MERIELLRETAAAVLGRIEAARKRLERLERELEEVQAAIAAAEKENSDETAGEG